jgi:hypothetical protein
MIVPSDIELAESTTNTYAMAEADSATAEAVATNTVLSDTSVSVP